MSKSRLPQLTLRDFELAAESGQGLTLAATGQLADADGTPMTDGAIRVGFGPPSDVPEVLRASFGELGRADAADAVLYAMTPADAQGANAWKVSIGRRRSEVLLVQEVPIGTTLQADGMQFAELKWHVAVVLRDGRVDTAVARLRGEVTLQASALPGFNLASATAACEFDFALGQEPSRVAEAVLLDPDAFLRGPFRARVRFELHTGDLTAGTALTCKCSELQFEADVSSPAVLGVGPGTLQLDRVGLSAKAAKLTAAKFDFTSLELSASWKDEETSISAAGSIKLPGELGVVLTGAPDAAGCLRGGFVFLQTASQTRMDLIASGLSLAPAVNPLGLSIDQLAMSLVWKDSSWGFSASANTSFSGDVLVRRLRAAGIALPPLNAAPVDCSFKIECTDQATGGTATLEITSAGGGVELPGVPLRIGDLELRLWLEFGTDGIGAWKFEGSSDLSTRDWLRELVPVDAKFGLTASAGGVCFTCGGDLPALTVPTFGGGASVELFKLTEISFCAGERFAVAASANWLERFNSRKFAKQLGFDVNHPFNPLATALGETLGALQGTIGVEIGVPGMVHADAEDVVQVRITYAPSDPRDFNLLKTLESLRPNANRIDKKKRIPASEDFFALKPRALVFQFDARAAERGSLTLAAQTDCRLFGEPFSADLTVTVTAKGPELALLAGSRDPIRLRIPAPSLDKLLGEVDWEFVGASYGDEAKNAAETKCKQLQEFFASSASDAFVFDVRDLGIRVCPEESSPIGVSGTLELVECPSQLRNVLAAAEGLAFTLGAEGTSIYVAIEFDDSASRKPLITVPVGPRQWLQFFLYELRFEYDCSNNSFGFRWRAEVKAEPPALLGGTVHGLGGVFVPQVAWDVSIHSTVTAPPVPVPEFTFRFSPESTRTVNDEMGLQVFIGNADDRLLTLYWSELAFSPSLYMLQPGLRFSGGMLAGGPPLKDYPTLQKLRHALTNRKGKGVDGEFYAFVDIKQATGVLVNPYIGGLLNPAALVPPFVTLIPPFWLAPPTLMGDVYCKECTIAINIPDLVFFKLVFKRPLPSLGLQAMSELVALVASGFSAPIPPGSALREVLFARLGVSLEVAIPTGSNSKSVVEETVEVNLADLLNGLVSVANAVRKTLDDGKNLVDRLQESPATLVRMIPFEKRNITVGEGDGLTIADVMKISGSLYLLTPEEMVEQLTIFHEGRRVRRKGLAALTAPGAESPGVLTGLYIVNDSITLDWTWTTTWTTSADPVRDLGRSATVVQTFVERRAKELAADMTERRKQVQDMRARQQEACAAIWDKVWEQVAAGRAATRQQRADLLARHGVGDHADEVERVYSQALQRRRPAALSPAERQRLRKQIAVALSDAMGLAVYPGTGPRPGELARRLVEEILPPAAGGQGPARNLKPARERRGVFERILPSSLRAAAPDLDAEFQRWAPAVAAQGDAGVAARSSLTAEVESALRRHLNPTRRSWQDADAPVPTWQELAGRARGGLPRMSMATKTRERKTPAFGGSRLRAALADGLKTPIQQAIEENTVEIVQGYEIRPTADVSVPAGQQFAMTVPGPNTSFRIQLLHGRYHVCAPMKTGGPEERTELPGWLVSGAGVNGAGVAAERILRSKLTIEERRERRREEAPRVDHETCDYRSSIFNRPEYQLGIEGGRHGTLNVADLLRRSDGTYCSPSEPVLLGGLEVAVGPRNSSWFSLKLAGLLAQPGNVFLFGHQTAVLKAEPYTLEMEGEFRLLLGTLWAGGPAAAGFERDAISFDGRVELKEGNTSRIKAQATGRISWLDRNPNIDLTLTLEIDINESFDFEGQELVKVVAEAECKLELSFSADQGFRMNSKSDFDIEVWLWSPKVTTEEVCWDNTCWEVRTIHLDEWKFWKVAGISGGGELCFTFGPNGLAAEAKFALSGVEGVPPELSHASVELDSLGY